MRISTISVEIDNICDYLPFVSIVSNGSDLFLKCVCKGLPQAVAKDRYWSHIREKGLLRCSILLMLPIAGNICVLIYDYHEYLADKNGKSFAAQWMERSQYSYNQLIASQASMLTGRRVAVEEMIVASGDEERLWKACCVTEIQTVRELLNSGSISPNFFHMGISPLGTACTTNSVETVQLLVDAGADVDCVNPLGYNPFQMACLSGNLEIVQLLFYLIKDKDIDSPDSKGQTPLMFAAARGSKEIVKFLLENGANPKKRAADGQDAVVHAIYLKDHAHLLPLFFKENERADDRLYRDRLVSSHRSILGLTPLLYATRLGAEKSALYLLERSNVLRCDSIGNSALHYSVGHMPVLKALLKRCNQEKFMNYRNQFGETALHRAIKFDQPEAALLLLQNGADPFIPNNENKSPLDFAQERSCAVVFEYIKNSCEDITPERSQQVEALSKQSVNSIPPPLQRPQKAVPSAVDLIATILAPAKEQIRKERESEALGPVPRTGMELLLGRI